MAGPVPELSKSKVDLTTLPSCTEKNVNKAHPPTYQILYSKKSPEKGTIITFCAQCLTTAEQNENDERKDQDIN